MKLNLDYYKKEDNLLKLTEEENTVIEYLTNQNNYEEIINKDNRLEIILALSNIKSNIVNWYPFKTNSKILELNANFGEITQSLCENSELQIIVTENSLKKAEAISKRLENKKNLEIIVGDFEEIKFNEKFNYILAIGVKDDFKKIIEFSNKYLEKDGVLLYAIDNEIGIKKINEISNIDQIETKKYRISKNKIIEILKEEKEFNYKFYYPMPDYEKTNIIFTDKYLPDEESILRDLTLYGENSIISFNEREFYKKLIKENIELFKECTSSYLIEISKAKIENKIKHISFGNSRKNMYRIKTVMLDDVVYKKAVSNESYNHIEQIKNNIEILKKLKFNILDSYKNEIIYSNLVKNNKSFDKILIDIFEKDGIEKMIEQINNFIEELKHNFKKSTEKEKDVFEKYKIEIKDQIKSKLYFVEDGIFDLIFQNCFYIDNKFYFYDQEWIEKNVPLEFIIYRAIFYLGNNKKEIDTQYVYEKLKIKEFLKYFEELENKLQEIIKDRVIWKIHANNNKTIKSLYDTQIHLRNLEAEKRIQKENEFKSLKKSKDIKIKEQQNTINQLTGELEYMKNSKSWKITKPLRAFRKKLN